MSYTFVIIERDLLEEVIASFEAVEEEGYDHGYSQLRVWKSQWRYLEHAVRMVREALA